MTLVLDPKLDLSAASDLLMSLRAKAGSDVVIDMINVTHMGALCLQVIISAARSAHGAGHAFGFVNTSDRVLDQLRLMGLTPETVAEGCP